MCDLQICRICLITAVRGYKLNQYSLLTCYEGVMRRKIHTKDYLPQWVCYECAMMLHKFHKFKEKCIKGQQLLKQISFGGIVTYEGISLINRSSKNLTSPISISLVSESDNVKTITVKHKSKTKSKPIQLEKVILNYASDDSMKHEDLKLGEVKNVFDNSITIVDQKDDEKLPLEQVEIKTETEPVKAETTQDNETAVPEPFDIIQNTNIVHNTETDTNNTKTNITVTNNEIENNTDINDDMGNTDHIDQAMSSEDENIFLDIVKKAVKGESKLVFLDNIDIQPVKKKKKYTKKSENKGKVRKFEKPKRQLLTPEHWRKFNLTEEEAMHEFKQREHNDQYVNANYKCHNCLKGFSKVEMLMRHVKFRHEESCGPIECRFCHMRFKQKNKLCKHLKQHYAVYQCLRCDMRFRLDAYGATCASDSSEYCFCDMRFKQKNKLCKHLKQHYAVYQCLRCDMRFRLESSAIFHEDYHNGVTRKCKYCGEEFKHSSTYYTHVRMSHRSAHVCVACGVSFVSAAGLQQHRRIKHYDNSEQEAAPNQDEELDTYCSKCDIRFETHLAYNEHLTHSNMHGDLNTDTEIARINLKGNKKVSPESFKGLRKKKPTTCQYCGKHFATQGLCMKHHLAEHPRRSFYPPDKRHICEICGQSLAAVSIASHMNRHTREHVYPCATCGMQFISKSSHHRHQVTHTGERPYPCPLCDKRFTQKNSMQLHYRTFHLKQPYPKRNRRKKTDVEIPIMECAMNRDRMQMMECSRSDVDSNDAPPARWRPTF